MLTLESWTPNPANLINAGMVELADTTDLGSVAERCAGSSPVTGTKGYAMSMQNGQKQSVLT